MTQAYLAATPMGKSLSFSSHRQVLALAALVGLLAEPSPAAPTAGGAPTSEGERYEQRAQYREARRLLRSGQRRQYFELKARLVEYPLYPYLVLQELSSRISRQDWEDIAAFQDAYDDTPPWPLLLRRWLRSQARKGAWQQFVDHYDPSLATKTLACHYPYALHRLGQPELAMPLAETLWTVDYSQPDECDPIFKVWRDAGLLTDEIAWQRFIMAWRAGNRTLARYLIRFLSKGDKAIAERYRQLQRNPALVGETRRFRADDDKTRELILYGIDRYARRNPERALEVFRTYLATHDFTGGERNDAYRRITFGLADSLDPNDLVGSLPLQVDGDTALIEALIRMHLKRMDWPRVLEHVSFLPPGIQVTNRWSYWRARALAELAALEPDPDGASATEGSGGKVQSIFERLAARRDFYGFLSADLLGRPYALENIPSGITPGMMATVASKPAFLRSFELLVLDDLTGARREWQFATRDLSPKQLETAAKLAQSWGWHEKAIQSMIGAERWNDLRVRFPLAYQDLFTVNARDQDIPLNWTFAIARQESAFMADARSPAGAMGIMQLMPGTAVAAAKAARISHRDKRQLLSAEHNIRIGTAYLGQMFRRFERNRIIASAAYNAGPYRAKAWLDPALPVDVWIETIPFDETRNYVQNVLSFAVIYSYRLDVRRPLIDPGERAYFEGSAAAGRRPGPSPSG